MIVTNDFSFEKLSPTAYGGNACAGGKLPLACVFLSTRTQGQLLHSGLRAARLFRAALGAAWPFLSQLGAHLLPRRATRLQLRVQRRRTQRYEKRRQDVASSRRGCLNASTYSSPLQLLGFRYELIPRSLYV